MTLKSLSQDQAEKLGKKSRAQLVQLVDKLTYEKAQLEEQTVASKFNSFVSELQLLGQDLAWLVNRTHELGSQVGGQVQAALQRMEKPQLALPNVVETTATEYPY